MQKIEMTEYPINLYTDILNYIPDTFRFRCAPVSDLFMYTDPENIEALHFLLRTFPQTTRELLLDRYMHKKTLKECAENAHMSISQSQRVMMEAIMRLATPEMIKVIAFGKQYAMKRKEQITIEDLCVDHPYIFSLHSLEKLTSRIRTKLKTQGCIFYVHQLLNTTFEELLSIRDVSYKSALDCVNACKYFLLHFNAHGLPYMKIAEKVPLLLSYENYILKEESSLYTQERVNQVHRIMNDSVVKTPSEMKLHASVFVANNPDKFSKDDIAKQLKWVCEFISERTWQNAAVTLPPPLPKKDSRYCPIIQPSDFVVAKTSDGSYVIAYYSWGQKCWAMPTLINKPTKVISWMLPINFTAGRDDWCEGCC